MSGCLACKACATQCPVRVDVPDFRAQFLELYYRRYARPLGDYLTALLERLLPLLAIFPRIANLFMVSVLGRFLTKLTAGIVDAPALDPHTASARLRAHGIAIAGLDTLQKLPKDARAVLVLQDPFTTFYEPKVLEAACLLIRKVGFEPYVVPYFENGKALHIKGFHGPFEQLVQKNSAQLDKLAALGFPMLGVEPAVTLTYRDEYPKLLAGKAQYRVALLQEWLAEQTWPALQVKSGASYRLLSHCTEQALVTRAPALWAKVFGAVGVPLELVKAGCCGMCGVYGHEAKHREDSLGIFALSWKKKIDPAQDRERVLVVGHSCRSQVERGLGFTPLHPAEALLAALQ